MRYLNLCLSFFFLLLFFHFPRCQFRVDCIEIKQCTLITLINYLVPVLLRFNTCTRYHTSLYTVAIKLE